MERDWLDKLIEGAKIIADAMDCTYTEVIGSLKYNHILGEEEIDVISFNMEENNIQITREELKTYGLYDHHIPL